MSFLTDSVKNLFGRAIERRLGGYEQQVVFEEPAFAPRATNLRIAVVGSGLAGLSAAYVLSERGAAVTLFERNSYLGGKVGAWKEQLADGSEARIEHGFHAFFAHYYNLTRILRSVGADRWMARIDQYCILKRDGGRIELRQGKSHPILNLIGLASHGFYRPSELLTNPKLHRLDALLRYDPQRTFEQFDQVSYGQFARELELSSDLLLLFHTFSRAFFADEDRLSLAELIKSFHFYYLSHNHGLLYDYVRGDYETCFLQPFAKALAERNAEIRTNAAVEAIVPEGDRFRIGDEVFDGVVLATDVAGTRKVLEASPALLTRSDSLRAQTEKLKPSQRYAIMRFWTSGENAAQRAGGTEELPVFVITEKGRALDAITFLHRIDPTELAWARKHRGGVYELHCYALPDDLPDSAVREAFLEEFYRYFPALSGAKIVREHMQIRQDFAAFHVGMRRDRPSVQTAVPGLCFAGDWVALPHPAMLMEAACMSGILAANTLLNRVRVRSWPVFSVPARGVLAQ